MADSTITGLPDASLPLSGSERIIVVQGGFARDATVGDVTTLVSGQNQHLRQFFSCQPASDPDDVVSSGQTWPSANSYSVVVPSWASRAIVIACIDGAYAVTSVLNHFVQIVFGSLAGSDARRIRWMPNVVGTSSGGIVTADGAVDQNSRQQIIRQAQFNVTTLRSTTVTVKTNAGRVSGTGGMRLRPYPDAYGSIDIHFFQV